MIYMMMSMKSKDYLKTKTLSCQRKCTGHVPPMLYTLASQQRIGLKQQHHQIIV